MKKKDYSLNAFEKKLSDSFYNHNILINSSLKIGAAVSGGADSVSLLLALFDLSKVYGFELYVITVNHFIRSEEETCGDVYFVENLCSSLNVKCIVCNLKKGQVAELSSKEKCGIEAAARTLRYNEFEKFINENDLDFLCLAHNKNDFLETVLSRVLQGSSSDGLSGIDFQRGKFIRPLLDVTRTEIENYLKEKNCSWRTDSTNADTNYLRNRIRHKLVPLLDSEFEGWQTGLTSLAEKSYEDNQFIQIKVEEFVTNYFCVGLENKEVRIPFMELQMQTPALLKRILIKACNLVSKTRRVPSVFLSEVEEWIKSVSGEKQGFKSYEDIVIQIEKNSSTKNRYIIVKKESKLLKELFFSVIIDRDGDYKIPTGIVAVKTSASGEIVVSFDEQSVVISDLIFPFCLRNYNSGDTIKGSDGNYKKVSEVYSSWKIPAEKRQEIIIVQKLNNQPDRNQDIKCILGGFSGYKNWIVG